MKNKHITVRIEEYDSEGELPSGDRELLEQAKKAAENAYAPYSEFHVGAAVMLKNGKIIKGANQENSAYPSGLCAERVTLFQAKSRFPETLIESLAITANTSIFDLDHPVTPCGACRQVIAEVEGRQNHKIRIIMQGSSGPVYISEGIENLLPLMFKEEKLKRSKSNRK